MASVIGSNPVHDVSPMRSKTRPKGASALTADELRGLLAKLRPSKPCERHDLVDPITLFIATGLRISELLGLRWTDFDDAPATLTITGKLVRAAGKGRGSEPTTWATRGCPRRRTPTWLAAGFTRRSRTCWTGL
jgi:integrase